MTGTQLTTQSNATEQDLERLAEKILGLETLQLSTFINRESNNQREQMQAHFVERRTKIADEVAATKANRAEVQALVLACEKSLPATTADECLDLVTLLLGSYPNTRANNPDVYTAALASVFENYPAQFGREAIRELPQTCKFLPTVFELTEMLQAKVNRRKAIHARAKYILQQEKEQGPKPEKYVDPEKMKKFLQEFKQQVAGNDLAH